MLRKQFSIPRCVWQPLVHQLTQYYYHYFLILDPFVDCSAYEQKTYFTGRLSALNIVFMLHRATFNKLKTFSLVASHMSTIKPAVRECVLLEGVAAHPDSHAGVSQASSLIFRRSIWFFYWLYCFHISFLLPDLRSSVAKWVALWHELPWLFSVEMEHLAPTCCGCVQMFVLYVDRAITRAAWVLCWI